MTLKGGRIEAPNQESPFLLDLQEATRRAKKHEKRWDNTQKTGSTTKGSFGIEGEFVYPKEEAYGSESFKITMIPWNQDIQGGTECKS